VRVSVSVRSSLLPFFLNGIGGRAARCISPVGCINKKREIFQKNKKSENQEASAPYNS
jgi:hypothetical protein